MSEPHGSPEQARLTPDERASLVAYLDGELSPEETEQIDNVLRRSHTARREVEHLTRTWEMLDALAHPKLPEDFSTKTLERIETEQFRRHLRGQQWARTGRRAAFGLGWLASLVAAGLIGFFALQTWPDKSRELLEDLPVIEELEMYQAVGDIEFLEKLNRQGEFGSDGENSSDNASR